jgi:hypothetical protein
MDVPPQLARPTESVLTPRFRACSCSGGHSGPAFARAFRRLCSSSTIPFRIRTYVNRPVNPVESALPKTQALKLALFTSSGKQSHLKPFRIRTYAKTGGWGADYC